MNKRNILLTKSIQEGKKFQGIFQNSQRYKYMEVVFLIFFDDHIIRQRLGNRQAKFKKK
jgi:hypothetical protein